MENNATYMRLIKVMVASPTVDRMDRAIAEAGYGDRAQFIQDAIEGHLADLREYTSRPSSKGPAAQDVSSGPSMIACPPDGIFTLPRTREIPSEPTWGMHNRDFPTLWALCQLVDAVQEAGEAIEVRAWIPEVVAAAWDVPRRLRPATRFDTSGFPANDAKREASEGRFLQFFIGSEEGTGPLFDLGLAATHQGRLAPTPAGLRLLETVAGFSCDREHSPTREMSDHYLKYLSAEAPADLEFLSEVLHLIASGISERSRLTQSVADAHPEWSESVVDTNVAGFIARAREWGLLARKQVQGKYLLQPHALDVLMSAGRDIRNDAKES